MAGKIELSYKELNDTAFVAALKGLVNHKWDSMTTAYSLKKILSLVDSESKKAFEVYQEHNRKTEFLPTESNNPRAPRIPVDTEAYKKFEEDFAATKCEVGNRFKLHVNDLIGYHFSAVDMIALESIIEGWEVLEASEPPKGEENESKN